MAEPAITTLARALGLEPRTLGFGDMYTMALHLLSQPIAQFKLTENQSAQKPRTSDEQTGH